MNQPRQQPSPPATPTLQRELTLLIADVVALTGVPAPQLRSWEQAGILHPQRSPNAIRLYGIEDVARVRLIKRSVDNPGRRGSLRRLAVQFAAGTLRPAPEDYAGLGDGTPGSPALTGALYWRAALDAMAELVVVCDTSGRATSINRALRALLPPTAEHTPAPASRSPTEETLPAALEALPLRWAAHTGTQHRDVMLMLRGPDGVERRTLWTVTPLLDTDGALRGAVGVGHMAPRDPLMTPEDWLAAAAHDLRSPVTNILGRVQLARRATARLGTAVEDAPERHEVVGQLEQHLAMAELSTIDLIRAMETLLDASAATSGTLIPHMDPGGVALDLLAREAVEHAQQHSSRHVITLEAPEARLLVAGDRIRLRQVLDNLLANALKYAPDGGPISVRLEAVTAPPAPPSNPPSCPPMETGDPHQRWTEPHWVVLRVKDTGLGIPAEAVPRVFDRYWRAGGATRHIPGTGLGLYICRAIVTAHGGHIWVEHSVPATDNGTEARGEHGTVMAMVLPLAASPGPAGTVSSVMEHPGSTAN